MINVVVNNVIMMWLYLIGWKTIMRNPMPDFIVTLVILTAIFIAVHSYNTSLRNDINYYDFVPSSNQRIG